MRITDHYLLLNVRVATGNHQGFDKREQVHYSEVIPRLEFVYSAIG